VDTEIWQEPARGGFADPAYLAYPGIDVLNALVERRIPRCPVERLTGRRLVECGPGHARTVMPASEWFAGPKGTVHSGALAFIADMPLLCAILSQLPARTLCTTAELSMTFLGAPMRTGGVITARARLIHADDRNGLSEVFVTDQEERLVAHATSRCSIIGAPGDTAEPPPIPPAPPDSPDESPDPYLRPVPRSSATFSEAERLRMGGLDLLRAQRESPATRPPIDRLTGIRLLEAGEGRAVFAMHASDWLRNEFGSVYGGAVVLLAKSAAAAAVQTLAVADTQFTALDVKVNLLRPIAADGGDLVATGTVMHRGRRLSIAAAEVMHGPHRVALATGTTAIFTP
jgi:acyl-CoA thioesterase